MKQRLFDLGPTKRRPIASCLALVVLPRDTCPRCGKALQTHRHWQAALFIHGGYGATRAETRRRCPGCRFELGAEFVEINPRAFAERSERCQAK